MKSRTVSNRFWSKVKKTKTCWLWLAAKTSGGYGSFTIKGKFTSAHRVSYILSYGPIPKGKGFHGICVLHKCDNTLCVKPSHLFLGSQKDNIKDRSNKKRSNRPVGETNGRARLTKKDILFIRNNKTKSQKELAIIYDTSVRYISRIVRKGAWKHV